MVNKIDEFDGNIGILDHVPLPCDCVADNPAKRVKSSRPSKAKPPKPLKSPESPTPSKSLDVSKSVNRLTGEVVDTPWGFDDSFEYYAVGLDGQLELCRHSHMEYVNSQFQKMTRTLEARIEEVLLNKGV